MASKLGYSGGNCYPTQTIVITEDLDTTDVDGLRDCSILLNPPIIVPAGSSINVNGTIQVSTTFSPSQPVRFKLTVMPWLADVQENKRHEDPKRPSIFPSDQSTPRGTGTFAYNASVGLSTGVGFYNPCWRLGNIMPHQSAVKSPQLPPDALNTLCDYRISNVWLNVGTPSVMKPSTSGWRNYLQNAAPGLNPSPAWSIDASAVLCLAQPCYVPYPTASSLQVVAAKECLDTAPGYLFDQSGYNPNITSSAGTYESVGAKGTDSTNRFISSVLNSVWDSSCAYIRDDRNHTDYPTDNLQLRGIPSVASMSICRNNVMPESLWAYRPLLYSYSTPGVPSQITVPEYSFTIDENNPLIMDLNYEDVLSTSPHCIPAQTTLWLKAPFSVETIPVTQGFIWPSQTYPPMPYQVLVGTDQDPGTCPMISAPQRNTTGMNAPFHDELHISQFGAIIPYDWTGIRPYSSMASRYVFNIKNDLTTFNSLTEVDSPRLLNFNLNSLMHEFHSATRTGRVPGIVSDSESFSAPPIQMNRSWADLWVLRPNSFFSPLVGHNDRILSTKVLEMVDMSGSIMTDNAQLGTTISCQDPQAISTGPGEQFTKRPNPRGAGGIDCKPTLDHLTTPTSFFRLPQIGYARPCMFAALGQGQAASVNDPTLPPIRPYNLQTFYATQPTITNTYRESGCFAKALSEHAVAAMGIRASSTTWGFCKNIYNTNDTTDKGTNIAVYPFTWWGYVDDHWITWYTGGTKASDYFGSWIPYLSSQVNNYQQWGFTQNGQKTISANTTTTPWGIPPTMPMAGFSDLTICPVGKGAPPYASMQPLFWRMNGLPPQTLLPANKYFPPVEEAANYINIGFSSSGALSAISKTGIVDTDQEPNAGAYHVAGRHVVLGDRAYGFLFNEEDMGYTTPFTVTAEFIIPAGVYTYETLGNLLTAQCNDPNAGAILTCNIKDDDGNDTRIAGCLNDIGYDPIYHDILWTNASSASASKSLPSPPSFDQLVKILSKSDRGFTEQLIPGFDNLLLLQTLYPKEWVNYRGSRAITAFRTSTGTLQANVSFTWAGAWFAIGGTTCPYVAPGGSSQGIAPNSGTVASLSTGFFTRCPADLQTVGLVAGASSGNPNNYVCGASDPIFLSRCYPYAWDMVLNDGAAGPIFPTRDMTGCVDISSLTMSVFSTTERSNFNGCSTTMSGTLLPPVINNDACWSAASYSVYLTLGNQAFMSCYDGPGHFLHRGPIVNPIKQLAFNGLSGVYITDFEPSDSKYQKYFSRLFGIQKAYHVTPELFYVSFVEGLRDCFDCQERTTRQYYHPDNFCYLSPHFLDSDLFTKPVDGSATVDDVTIGPTSFMPMGRHTASPSRPFVYQHTTDNVVHNVPKFTTLQGYRPLPSNNRFISLSNLGEIMDKRLCTISSGYNELTTPWDTSSRQVPASFQWKQNTVTNACSASARSALPNGLASFEQKCFQLALDDCKYPFRLDVTAMPAYYPISCMTAPQDSPANYFYNGPVQSPYTLGLQVLPKAPWGPITAPRNESHGLIRPFQTVTSRSTYVPFYLQTINYMTGDLWCWDQALSSSGPMAYGDGQFYNELAYGANEDDPTCLQSTQFLVAGFGQNSSAGYLHQKTGIPKLACGNLGYPGAPSSVVSPVPGDYCYRYAHPLLPVCENCPINTKGFVCLVSSESGESLAVNSGFCNVIGTSVAGSGWPHLAGLTNGINNMIYGAIQNSVLASAICYPAYQAANVMSNDLLGWITSYNFHASNYTDPVSQSIADSYPYLPHQLSSHFNKLPRNSSQGPCLDADSLWIFNTWQVQTQTFSPTQGPGSVAPKSHVLMTEPHSNYMFHMYHQQWFGCLQQHYVHCNVELDLMEPKLRPTLGWLGTTKCFNYNGSPAWTYWDTNSSAPIYSPVAQGSLHYPGPFVENSYTLASPNGMSPRYYFPLAYVQNNVYAYSSLQPVRASLFFPTAPAGGRYQGYNAGDYHYSPVRTSQANQEFMRFTGSSYNPMPSSGSPFSPDPVQFTYCPPLQITVPGYYTPYQDPDLQFQRIMGTNYQPIVPSENNVSQVVTHYLSLDRRSVVNCLGWYPLTSLQNGINDYGLCYPPMSIFDTDNYRQFLGENTYTHMPVTDVLNADCQTSEYLSTDHGSGLFMPEPIQISFVYPAPSDLPWTEYYMQAKPESRSFDDIPMSFVPLNLSDNPMIAFAKTPCILQTIGPAQFCSSTYSSLGIHGPPSEAIAKALGYLPFGPFLGPPNKQGYISEKPKYKPLDDWTPEDVHLMMRYRRRYRIARRMAFIHSLPQDPIFFSIATSSLTNSTNAAYQSDTSFSGPRVNFNDSSPVDINGTIVMNPQFSMWNLGATIGMVTGEALLVSLDTEPPIFSMRSDIRVNRVENTVSDRLLTKELVIPQPAPQEVSELATYTYAFSLAPPLTTQELTRVVLSISQKDGSAIENLFSHNTSITITPALNAGPFIGFGISSEESVNPAIPTLQYVKVDAPSNTSYTQASS